MSTQSDSTLAKVMTNEALLTWFADEYGMCVFCDGGIGNKETVDALKEEILSRMKKSSEINSLSFHL